MADAVTKNPQFATDADIKAENDRRKASIETFLKKSADQIRDAIRCILDGAVGRAHTPPPGEILYVNKDWLVRPEDRSEFNKLVFSQGMIASGGGMGEAPVMPSPGTMDMVMAIQKKIDA